MPDNPTPQPAAPNFEEALERLETIVHELEEGEIGLAEALARYENGVQLLKQCYSLLEHAERRIEQLCGFDADGNPVVQPFDESATFTPEEPPKKRSRREKRDLAPRPPLDESDSANIDTPRGLF